MYEGWVCFGGTEVINNMRAIGYASTASQLENRWGIPSEPQPEQTLATNLFTNPSSEAGSGTVEVRRNFIVNPTPPVGAAQPGFWTLNRLTGSLSSPEPGVVMYEATEASALTQGVVARTLGQTWSGYYGGRVEVKATGSLIGQTFSAIVHNGAQIATSVGVKTYTGDWQTVDILASGVAAGTAAAGVYVYIASQAVGDRLYVRQPQIEKVGGISGIPGTFFAPGLPSPDPDLTPAWVGAANASESVLRGTPVTGMPPVSGQQFNYQTADSPAVGAFAGRVNFITTGAIGIAQQNISLAADATYTLLMRVRPKDRDLVASPRIQNNVAAPMTFPVGVWTEVRVTMPAGASASTTQTGLLLAAGSGHQIGDRVDIDAALLAEGEYTGPYFDGSTPDGPGRIVYDWLGAPNASTSYQLLSYVPGEYPNYCDINWFDKDDDCPNLWDALNEPYNPLVDESTLYPYEAQYIQQDAPWSSESVYEAAEKFLGAYAISITSLSDATRTVPIVEGILDGGILGRSRKAVPTFRFRVLLTAVDMEGLEYGTSWLIRALGEQNCSFHGPSCGSTDMTFFASCPPPIGAFITDEGKADPNWAYNLLLRSYHDVKCVEGPVVSQELFRGENSWGRIVEFTMAAGVANLFGSTGLQEGTIDGSSASVITDVPRNAIPTPSAELPTGGQIVATNYSTNPSVETNATGWVVTNDSVNITPAMCVGARVTGELAAVGTASFRVIFTATGAGTNGWFGAQQQVEIAGRPAGSRVSINMWSAEILTAGTPVRTDITMTAIWRNGGTEISRQTIGTLPVDGGAVTATSLLPPAGTTNVIVRAQANLTSWPAGTIVRMYSDALAVTVP